MQDRTPPPANAPEKVAKPGSCSTLPKIDPITQEALQTGQPVRCGYPSHLAKGQGLGQFPKELRASVYCIQCQKPYCLAHSARGFCAVCRALVRSIGALRTLFEDRKD